ncbi:MAG: hypothetical protein ABSF98_13285, partial [Bryobacteraceae bacterium]
MVAATAMKFDGNCRRFAVILARGRAGIAIHLRQRLQACNWLQTRAVLWRGVLGRGLEIGFVLSCGVAGGLRLQLAAGLELFHGPIAGSLGGRGVALEDKEGTGHVVQQEAPEGAFVVG